jgi:hypothetical protein
MRHKGFLHDEGAINPDDRRGTYPPDIARRRRQLGLPVTPAEHVAYARGEQREPPVTELQMARTLRDVPPRCAPLFAHVLREVARRSREPGQEG